MNHRPLDTSGPVTPDEVRAVKFQLIRRGGYDPGQVDPFLDLIAQALAQPPNERRLDAATIHGVRFTTVRRGGYLPEQVDAFLDRVIDTLNVQAPVYPEPQPRRPPASVETAAMPPAVHTPDVDTSPEADFERLRILHRSGVLSDREFAVLGARVKRRIGAPPTEAGVPAGR